LRNVSFDVKRGRLFALLGPNGAGKSTLVRILTTLSQRDSGTVRINGMDPELDASRLMNCIGVVSQDNALDPVSTPREALVFQSRLFGSSAGKATARADALLHAFGLEAEKEKRIESLSGGYKRRLHAALAMVHSPEVLFLDEPTVGMEPGARSMFWAFINSYKHNEGATVFLTTQYLDEVERYADSMALLVEGTIRYTGSVPEFKRMAHPDEGAALEDSFIKYLQDLPQQTNLSEVCA